MNTSNHYFSSAASILRGARNRLAVATGVSGLIDGIKSSPQNIRIIRFAVGVALSIALTSAINWPLSFLVPILLTIFLAMPVPKLSLKHGLANMLITFTAFLIGFVFTTFLLPFPFAYIPLLGLILFSLFYWLNRGGALWFVLMTLLAVLILPMLGSVNASLEITFALGFVWSGWVTILMVWLAYFLVPDQIAPAQLPKKAGFQPGYSEAAMQAAVKSTIVILPIAVTFIMLELTDYLLIMVFAAIFTLSPNVSKGKEAGINSLKSTAIGGFYAFFVYVVLIAVPEYYFFVVLMFLAALIFATNIFSDKPTAQYYASGFTTLYILINASLAGGSDFMSIFLSRFSLIMLATIYVVFSLMVFDRFWPKRKDT